MSCKATGYKEKRKGRREQAPHWQWGWAREQACIQRLHGQPGWRLVRCPAEWKWAGHRDKAPCYAMLCRSTWWEVTFAVTFLSIWSHCSCDLPPNLLRELLPKVIHPNNPSQSKAPLTMAWGHDSMCGYAGRLEGELAPQHIARGEQQHPASLGGTRTTQVTSVNKST